MRYNLVMALDGRMEEFVEKALAAGVPHATLVGMLTARGWAEKEVYAALAGHYERATGLTVPGRAVAGTSAREAFFYLLSFATLASWTLGLGFLAFDLIDRWLADPVFSPYGESFGTLTITSSLAALLVAFPLYLLISRAVLAELRAHPEKAESSIRKWLTYMALVIAAGVLMGDLIAALTYLLRGEITSRFVAKALVVLGLSGGVFGYYFGGLRRSGRSGTGRDRVMAGAAAVAVGIAVVLGFLQLGSPKQQRGLRADTQRVQALYRMSLEVNRYWTGHEKQLPADAGQMSDAGGTDPVSGGAYEYHPGAGSRYELCAVFTQPSGERGGMTSAVWRHPAGRHCFPLDAASMTQYPR